MSLSELMETPSYSVLQAQFSDTDKVEWTLSADAFIKFQIRRQCIPGAGHEALKKNYLKILTRLDNNMLENMDELADDTVKYVRHVLWSSELYVLHSTDIKVHIQSWNHVISCSCP